MDQIRQLKPPENPAKNTDSRFKSYVKQYGRSSWELDALSPTYLADLITNNVTPLVDEEAWAEKVRLVADTKAKIEAAAAHFGD